MENDPSDDPPSPANLPIPAEEAEAPETPREKAYREKPYRVRHDGWTAERQNIFIESLAKTRCVRDASRMAGISWNSAYNHRKRSAAFAERWALALRRSDTTIGEVTWQRAVEGVEEDVWYHGKVVGQRTKYANDLLRLLYQHDTNGAARDAAGRFAPAGEGAGDGVDDGAGDGAGNETGVEPDAGAETVAGGTIIPDWLALPAPQPGQPPDTLEQKLKKINVKLNALGNRNINLRTCQGMTDEVVEAVQRFVAGGRVMLPSKMKWLSPERFAEAKADYLATHPGGVPKDADGAGLE
ncbi:hypothetical protein [Sphingorhabdus sp. Alg231-15]|uniref:hypothetical protein n=1 Tax=Sphingorhabdus sp. Alg231-15 TaxID=1922222 RepID=UPI000D54B5CE